MKRTLIISLTLLLLLAMLAACQLGPSQPTPLPAQTETLPAPVSGIKSSAAPHTLPATVAPYPAITNEPIRIKPTGIISTTAPVTATEEMPVPAWDGSLPILLKDNQGLTFGPGQTISVYAQHFQPGEDIAVAMVHETQGVVFNKMAKADALGHVQAARRLTKTAQEKDALPAGSYTYQLTGASQVQAFTFQVDYSYQPAANSKGGCGAYPGEAVFEGHLVIFCQGLLPNTSYTLTSTQGEKYDGVVTTSDPFGRIVFPLRLTSKTLGPGKWVFSLGKTTTQYGKPQDLGFPTISIPVLSSQEVHP